MSWRAVALPAAGAHSLRARTWLVPLALGGATAAIAADQGGFAATTWGWMTLGFLWVAGLALVLSPDLEVGLPEIGFLGLLMALAGWIALSIAWSENASTTVSELERALVYPAGGLAFVLVARRAQLELLLAAIMLGISGVAVYSLVQRLFPDARTVDTNTFDYRLYGPLGYWNALGIVTAIAILLAAGLWIHARVLWVRCFLSAALVPLLATLYYTYSRGAWLALALGVVVALVAAVDRLRLVTGLLLLAAFPALGVWLASRPAGLTVRGVDRAQAVHDGHQLAWQLLLVSAAAAAVPLLVAYAERELRITPELRRRYVAGLLVAVAVVVIVFAAVAHPVRRVSDVYDSVVNDAPANASNQNQRLTDLSSPGRKREWHVALKQFHHRPLTGTGAGTFQEYWYRYGFEPGPASTSQAHSLYVETLGELGLVGLALVLAALAIPFAGVRARARPVVPLALGGYAAFVAHAGIDWDWEMPAVTLTGVFCGLALLVATRGERTRSLAWGPARWGGLAAVVAVGGFALVALVGNLATASAEKAVNNLDWKLAESRSRQAAAWNPWAARPWAFLAQAQLGQSRRDEAIVALREAIERESHDYTLWGQLAVTARGAEREQARQRANELDPREPIAP